VILAPSFSAMVTEALEAAGCDTDGEEFAVPGGYDWKIISNGSVRLRRTVLLGNRSGARC
jgi:hypothetical protein